MIPSSHLSPCSPSFAKTDLHRHLSGSIRAATLFELMDTAGLNLPVTSASELEALSQVRSPVPSLKELIAPPKMIRAWNILELIVTDTHIANRLMVEAVEDASTDGVTYVEFRISPHSVELARHLTIQEFIGALTTGLAEGYERFGTVGKLILSLSRHNLVKLDESLREAYYSRLLDAADVFGSTSVVGFDLVGIEDAAPAHMFQNFFNEAKLRGFGITIHAGEGESARNIREAIELLGADRIAHGLTLFEDRELLERVVAEQIIFEQCLTSNIMTSVVPAIDRHPLPQLLEAGVQVVLCSDNPAMFGIALSDEYALAKSQLGLTDDHLRVMESWAIEGKFRMNG